MGKGKRISESKVLVLKKIMWWKFFENVPCWVDECCSACDKCSTCTEANVPWSIWKKGQLFSRWELPSGGTVYLDMQRVSVGSNPCATGLYFSPLENSVAHFDQMDEYCYFWQLNLLEPKPGQTRWDSVGQMMFSSPVFVTIWNGTWAHGTEREKERK